MNNINPMQLQHYVWIGTLAFGLICLGLVIFGLFLWYMERFDED